MRVTGGSVSLRPVYVAAGFFSLMAAVYALAGVEPSSLNRFAMGFGPLVGGVVWLRRDASAHGMWLPHDWGFFALLGWPVLLPWYALKTRRRGAAGLVARLAAALWAPALTGAVVSAIRAAARG
jgi:hypothetical protein